ncbi:MAG TPA: flavodoxin domain-containing protein [Streptosporangiaceae bacterium]|nr:flavodoxin domain-containing protein [Streptosporangiaceae bacterium]
MRVLVVYGSKRGGTAGLAAMIGGALEDAGMVADVAPARTVRSLSDYDAVIVGGALYIFRWHRDARRFVRRHAAELSALPVWLFSSGPLDDSAARGVIEPVDQVKMAMRQCHARGHMTFGGRLAANARGFPASAMAKKNAGDWRDPAHVTRWVNDLVEQLGQPEGAAHDGSAVVPGLAAD